MFVKTKKEKPESQYIVSKCFVTWKENLFPDIIVNILITAALNMQQVDWA